MTCRGIDLVDMHINDDMHNWVQHGFYKLHLHTQPVTDDKGSTTSLWTIHQNMIEHRSAIFGILIQKQCLSSKLLG